MFARKAAGRSTVVVEPPVNLTVVGDSWQSGAVQESHAHGILCRVKLFFVQTVADHGVDAVVYEFSRSRPAHKISVEN